MLVFAIGFNLWLYRLEPTATIDPNDNTFQYALVDRTNQIWDFADKKCSNDLSRVTCHLSLLIDHWVPNWAQGYNLPTYYSHIPQIAIVASYRLFHPPFSLFQYYHLVIYLLLCFFPLSVFLALRIVRLPWLVAGIGALLASHISTDGLYGLDPPSFLWRGYGLSSQLFAMIPLPLALACSWRYFEKNSSFALAVFFLIATTSGHLGIGIVALLSLIPLSLVRPSVTNMKKLVLLAGTTVFFLSYWIIPVLLYDNYHNISIWDPPWKFNSYGAKEIMIRLFNGDLFDFGRFPILTLLIIVGLLSQLSFQTSKLPSFSLLFIFWLLLYFGRTTWGGLIDLVPGMKEFHLSRFIVGLHAAGFFLAPLGLWSITESIKTSGWLKWLIAGTLVMVVLIPTYQQTIRYNDLNDKLILQANANYAKVKPDADGLIAELKTRISQNPGRVYAGRGGNWGKDFRVAETPYNIFLSTFGIPVVLWLPETWSPNSDVEQYFSEDNLSTYNLFGIRYVAAPPTVKPFAFWKLVKEAPTWKLYVITNDVIPGVTRNPSENEETKTGSRLGGRDDTTQGYFTTGVRPAIVSVDKRNYKNVVRSWVQGDKTHAQGLYPELTFDKDYPRKTGLPNFRMIDEATYQVPDNSTHNLFREPPLYLAPSAIRPTIVSQSSDSDMIFRAKVDVPKDCTDCIVILKQSFHPTWRATIDGTSAQPFFVFPVFLAVSVPEGAHDVVFSYEPSTLKMTLLALTLLVLGGFWGLDKYIKSSHSGL